jgi:hypothetical protein
MEKNTTKETIYFPTEKQWYEFVNRNRNSYLKLDNQVLATYNAQMQQQVEALAKKYNQLLDDNTKLLEKNADLLELYHANFNGTFFSTSKTMLVTINKN